MSPAAAVRRLCERAIPWQDLIQELPVDNALFDFGLRGERADLDEASKDLAQATISIGEVRARLEETAERTWAVLTSTAPISPERNFPRRILPELISTAPTSAMPNSPAPISAKPT